MNPGQTTPTILLSASNILPPGAHLYKTQKMNAICICVSVSQQTSHVQQNHDSSRSRSLPLTHFLGLSFSTSEFNHSFSGKAFPSGLTFSNNSSTLLCDISFLYLVTNHWYNFCLLSLYVVVRIRPRLKHYLSNAILKVRSHLLKHLAFTNTLSSWWPLRFFCCLSLR